MATSRFQNNFTGMFFSCLFTKIAEMVALGWKKRPPELKIGKKQALQGLLTLLVLHVLFLWAHHMVIFPC